MFTIRVSYFRKNARLALGNTKIKAATKQFEGKKWREKRSRINVVLDVIPQCSTFPLYEPLVAASRHVFSSSVMSPRGSFVPLSRCGSFVVTYKVCVFLRGI